eukprot:6525706-Prymnesium_polylepis.1
MMIKLLEYPKKGQAFGRSRLFEGDTHMAPPWGSSKPPKPEQLLPILERLEAKLDLLAGGTDEGRRKEKSRKQILKMEDLGGGHSHLAHRTDPHRKGSQAPRPSHVARPSRRRSSSTASH